MNQNYIELNWVKRSTQNMSWWYWIEHNWVRYYSFDEAVKTAKEQGLILPTLRDFINSGFIKFWLENNKQLADKLWLKLDGYCDSDGLLNNDGEYGFLGSVSEYNKDGSWSLTFDEDKGGFYWSCKSVRFVCRPLIESSSSDDSSIWLFEKVSDWLVNRWVSLSPKEWIEFHKLITEANSIRK